jgi:hypothetical protein
MLIGPPSALLVLAQNGGSLGLPGSNQPVQRCHALRMKLGGLGVDCMIANTVLQQQARHFISRFLVRAEIVRRDFQCV